MDLPPLRHPVLSPGVRVLRRGSDEVQVGLDPRRALAMRTSVAVRRTLAVVTAAGPADDADPDLLAALRERGLVTEHAAGRVARAPTPVRLLTAGVAPPSPDLLAAAGLRVASAHEPAPVGLLVATGEPERALLDPWVVEGLPHLVLRFVEGDAVVGPFVLPGHTPCVRCLDAHHTDDDRHWPLLVAQQHDGVAEIDPLLRTVATGWALGELRSHLAARRPATWGATLRLGRHLAESESVAWRRHPECGCADDPLHTR
ncbi:MAG: hypothetical protein JWO46_2431 [Nocardioidaceae bacterium]|nr:hypothetical protein [Nocardioidaceae bacterium]